MQANLSEVLDQALARIRAGESVEACLADYPEYAPALAPLLRTGALLHEEADTALPADLEAWLPTGARDFAAIAQQMLPQPSSQEQPATAPARPSKRAPRILSTDLSEILDLALARVGAGESVDVCLSDYPEHAHALAPLLSTGELLHAHAAVPLPPDLEAWLPRGAREFNAIAERMAPRYAVRRKATPPRKLSLQRTMATMAVAVALMGVVADTASAASLPGDPLYQWKRTKEDISLTLTTDPRLRSQLHVDYAQRRLSEFNTLLTNGDVGDTTMIADTLNNMLVHTQGAIDEAQQGRNIDEVKPALYQLLNQAEGAINQASAVAPQAEPIFDQAREEVNALEQHLPAVVASGATQGSEPTASATDGSTSAGAPTAEQGDLQTPVSEPSSQPTSAPDVPTATPVSGQPSAPSATSGSGILPTDAPTAVPSNTPTTDPATVVPPTQVPPTNAPEPPGSTAVPTAVPPTAVPPSETPLPTNTPPPTATPIPTATDGPLPTLPPTPPPRPSRTPLPTRTSTPTDTPPPTNTPTDVPTDTPQPSDTPTDVPTDTPTDLPTFTPTDIPTATATVFGLPGTSDQTSTPTSPPSPSAMPGTGSETPTLEPATPTP